jgi:hypothetical protein
MKKYSTVYFLLLALLLLGAFASMAQYSYGMKICGLASLGFTVAFLVELWSIQSGEKKRIRHSLELASLTLLSLIFTLRNFSVEWSYFNVLQTIAFTVLIFLLGYAAFAQIRALKTVREATAIGMYYTSIVLFLFSALVGIIFPQFPQYIILAALASLALFLVLAAIVGPVSSDRDAISTWGYLRHQLKDKSALILIACILVIGFGALHASGVLPRLYYGTYPQGYQNLIESGVTSSDQNKSGEFKKRYEVFLERNSSQ